MSRLVFDIGGTHMRYALADGGVLKDLRKVPTPEPTAAIEALRVYATSRDGGIDSAVGGIAGIIQNGVVIDSPNLPAWNGFTFKEALERVLGVPVTVYNDAAVAALGEARAGSGTGKRIVGYLTVGTGVGGALIVDGEVAPHAQGFEPGKQVIDVDTSRTLEAFVGGAAIRTETGEAAETQPRAFYDERTKALAVGLYDAIRLWSPDIFILNGALMNEETAFRLDDVVRELLALAGDAEMPPVVRAAFGDESGLRGAALA